jgi:hypothetical protein
MKRAKAPRRHRWGLSLSLSIVDMSDKLRRPWQREMDSALGMFGWWSDYFVDRCGGLEMYPIADTTSYLK